jgi:uncharacterized membrane protein YccC
MAAGADTTGAVNERSAWPAFRQSLTRFDRSKLSPWVALRNTVGFALPLVSGLALGYPNGGLAVAAGALNVSYSDKDDPYLFRVQRMIAASVFVALAVFCGCLSGGDNVLAVIIAGIWAFAAGMLVALSPAAADVGLVSLVTLLVFEAAPRTREVALSAALLALGGGLFQTLITMLMWPLRRYAPARRVLAQLYWELAQVAISPLPVVEGPPATATSLRAHTELAGVGGERSVEADRYRSLLNQAERLRLSLIALRRLRARLRRDETNSRAVDLLNEYFEAIPELLNAVGGSLQNGHTASPDASALAKLRDLSDAMRRIEADAGSGAEASIADARRQMDAVTGQIRAAVDLASHSSPAGAKEFERREVRKPWSLRVSGTLATVGANLNLNSAAFRHALRLAVCVVIGDAIGRGLGLQRSYWLAMTIAIVLKPDFTATFSRGVLRLAGTFAGLVFATALFHTFPTAPAYHAGVMIALMFLMRWIGGANYGVFVAAVTALVVFMIALAGISPKAVMAARAWNTVLGGLISLAAYWLWPTWERTQTPDAVAGMLDSYREYFQALRASYELEGNASGGNVNQARVASRLARSNAEASVDRMLSEPRVSPEVAAAVNGLMASAHRLAHALMSLEAGLAASGTAPAREAFRAFAGNVEKTLHYLAFALRGSPLRKEDLPDLREYHTALVNSGDATVERYALVNVETDRITNSLNTLGELVLRWMQLLR